MLGFLRTKSVFVELMRTPWYKTPANCGMFSWFSLIDILTSQILFSVIITQSVSQMEYQGSV